MMHPSPAGFCLFLSSPSVAGFVPTSLSGNRAIILFGFSSFLHDFAAAFFVRHYVSQIVFQNFHDDFVIPVFIFQLAAEIFKIFVRNLAMISSVRFSCCF